MKADLEQVLDLALGTPELGVVNLRVLHVFLHEILVQLNLTKTEVQISDEARSVSGLLGLSSEESITTPDIFGSEERLPSLNDNDDTGNTRKSYPEHSKGSKVKIGIPDNRLKKLEEKFGHFEEKLSFLDDLPPADEITKWMKEKEKTTSVASDMWQFTNLQRRLGAVEDGTSRLSSLVDSILAEMKLFEKVRGDQEKISDRLKKLEDDMQQMSALRDSAEHLLAGLDRLKELEKMEGDLKSLTKEVEYIQSSMVPRTDLEKHYVKWEVLGQALNANRKSQEDVNSAYYFSPVTNSDDKKEFDNTDVSNTLAQLGALLDEHRDVLKDIEVMKEVINGKANLEDLQNMINSSAFAELDEQVRELHEAMDDIKIWREDLENEVLRGIKKSVNGMEKDVARLENTCKEIIDEQNRHKLQVDDLNSAVNTLNETKADKEETVFELSKKVDKANFDHLISRSKFDASIGKIDEDIQEVNRKLDEHEEICDNTTLRLVKDVEGKLDRAELEVLREYLEKMLRTMKQKAAEERDDDPAAGFRKGLLHFNCLSCNRPVYFGQNGVIQSVQYQSGQQSSRSSRPHTAGRQGSRNDGYESVASLRSCGGLHTSTIPPRRITAKLNSAVYRDEDVIPLPPGRSEVDIQGQDGRYYKGRVDKRVEVLPEDSIKSGPPTRPKAKSAHCSHRTGSTSPPTDESGARRFQARNASYSPQPPETDFRSREEQLVIDH